MTTAVRSTRKTREGVVVSAKMDKTVVVRIERLTRHPVYKKVLRRGRNFKAHDELNECREGDRVRIVECRPLSKDKSFRVVEIVTTPRRPDEPIPLRDSAVELLKKGENLIAIYGVKGRDGTLDITLRAARGTH